MSNVVDFSAKVLWSHLRDLYERDSGKGSGLAMVPKLKFEHISGLSSFAKMRVDLAAQVYTLKIHLLYNK